jgi:hypothetical protein
MFFDTKSCNQFYVPDRILCTLYGAVDFLNVLKKVWWAGGVVEVHSEIHYVPLGEGWEEVVVRNV